MFVSLLLLLFCSSADEEEFKATATVSALNTARPPATATVRQGQPRGGRGGAAGGGAGRRWVRLAGGGGVWQSPTQITEQTAPIQISDSSETSEDDEDDEDDDDHFGFGRCFRCGESVGNHSLTSYNYISDAGERGHWVRSCPY